LKNFSVRFGFVFRNLKPEKPQPVGGYYKYKKKCLFLTLASTGLQSSFSLILLASTGLQSSFSLILSHSLTIHISHFHVHAQICNCNKIKLIHHLHPQPATSLSHTIFIFKLASQPHPSLTPEYPTLNHMTHTIPTHWTSRVRTSDLANQSGSHLPLSHLILNRVTIHTRYDFFFLSILFLGDYGFFFNSKKKSRQKRIKNLKRLLGNLGLLSWLCLSFLFHLLAMWLTCLLFSLCLIVSGFLLCFWWGHGILPPPICDWSWSVLDCFFTWHVYLEFGCW
jgi:hypothetical protein